MLIDVHTHLDHEQFKDDIDEVIKRAKDAGLKLIINNGTDSKSNMASLELAKKYDIIKCAMGIYPPDALGKEDFSINIEDEVKFIKKNRKNIIAIGEVGLDGKNGNIEIQKPIFEEMIKLSKSFDIPIIVHSRKAELQCIEMLEQHGVKKVIMHCFSGKKSLVKRCAENRWYFSIPPNCVRSSHFQNIIKIVSINQLLTETDAPYLSPYPEKRNEPAYVKETIKVIAGIKSFEEEEVINNIYLNYMRLF